MLAIKQPETRVPAFSKTAFMVGVMVGAVIVTASAQGYFAFVATHQTCTLPPPEEGPLASAN